MSRARLLVSLLLAGCGPAVVSAPPSAAERLASLWPQLAGGSVADRITDPMVSIRHDQGPSARYHPSWIGVAIDGNVLFARRLDRTRPPEGELTVYDGRLRPGRHRIGVYLQINKTPDERLASEPTAQLSLGADRDFVVTEGQFATITTRTRDYAEGSPPSLDIELQYRPIRND